MAVNLTLRNAMMPARGFCRAQLALVDPLLKAGVADAQNGGSIARPQQLFGFGAHGCIVRGTGTVLRFLVLRLISIPIWSFDRSGCRFLRNGSTHRPEIHSSVLGIGSLCRVALRRVGLHVPELH